MTDDVIVLLKDGPTAVMKKEKVRGNLEKVIPREIVHSVLIPVGIYSPQYILFKRSDLIDNFISATISYQMTIYDIGALGVISDELPEIRPVNVKCKCLPDLYLSLHSLCKLDGFNMVYMSTNKSTSLLNKAPMPRVANLSISIKTNDGTHTLNLSSTKHWTQKLDKFFSKEFDVSCCLPSYMVGSRVYINTAKAIWQTRGSDWKGTLIEGIHYFRSNEINPVASDKDVLISAGLIRYNCMTFVHGSDMILLDQYSGSIHITAFNEMEMMENIELDGPINYYTLLDHPNYFSIITDSVYELFTPSDIIEAVMTIRHTLTTWQVVNEFISGGKPISTYDDTNVMVSIILRNNKYGDSVQPFTYEASIVEHEDLYIDDYYDDFITKLKEYQETID